MNEFALPHRHGEKNIGSLKAELSRHSRFTATAEIFKQLSDPTRLQIFWLLCHQEECVINIAALLDMSSPAVSHHLRSLHDSGLITSMRDGKEVYYKAAETKTSALLHKSLEQVMEIACPENAVDYNRSTREIVQHIHEYLLKHLGDRVNVFIFVNNGDFITEAIRRILFIKPVTINNFILQGLYIKVMAKRVFAFMPKINIKIIDPGWSHISSW